MKLIKFLILSVIIHFLILFWGNVPSKKQRSPNRLAQKNRVELKVAKKERAKADRERKPKVKTGIPKPEVKEGPVRLRPNEIPVVKEKKALSGEKKIDKTRETTISEVEKEEPREKNVTVKKTSPEKRVLRTRFKTQDDYRGYQEKMDVGQVEGLPVPNLIVVYSDEDEILAVTHYFNLKMIVYGKKDGKEQPVLIEVENPNNSTFRQIQSIDQVNFSNRVREREGNPFFDRLLDKAVQDFGLEKYGSHLISLIPNDVDLYFRYKQIECAKRNGIDPFSVKTTYARYHLTDIGVWILAVERMKLKDGRTVSVRDFELYEVKS